MKHLIAATSALLLISLSGAAWADSSTSSSDSPAKSTSNKTSAKRAQKHDAKLRQARRFNRIDQNQDGVLTIAEMQAKTKVRMARKDKNQDGVLSKEEFVSSAKLAKQNQNATDARSERKLRRAEQRFSKLDQNGDAKLTQQEILTPVQANFARLDSNHDGVLTKEEMARSHKASSRARNQKARAEGKRTASKQ